MNGSTSAVIKKSTIIFERVKLNVDFLRYTPKISIADIFSTITLPLVAILLFLGFWGVSATQVKTSLGVFPGPIDVWYQAVGLYNEHLEEQDRAAAFYQRQEKRNARALIKNPDAKIKIRPYNGRPTFFYQILTSLFTVFVGFALASLIAIPLGILCGFNRRFYNAVSPLIQLFKPVSPLAWLPIVTMVVSAVYSTEDPMFAKSFVTSAIVVTLCSLWPTVINTASGVANIDQDLINVGRVIRLHWFTRVWRIAIPAALPMIFSGLRISLGIGWMVLIAAEMLAQNPGLGKFVWDEFQNGSSNSLGRIMVAILAIGLIGFVLDWIMVILQRMVSHGEQIN